MLCTDYVMYGLFVLLVIVGCGSPVTSVPSTEAEYAKFNILDDEKYENSAKAKAFTADNAKAPKQ